MKGENELGFVHGKLCLRSREVSILNALGRFGGKPFTDMTLQAASPSIRSGQWNGLTNSPAESKPQKNAIAFPRYNTVHTKAYA